MGNSEVEAIRCRHCGKLPDADGDHSCPCPYPDDACPDHPRPDDPWNQDAEVKV